MEKILKVITLLIVGGALIATLIMGAIALSPAKSRIKPEAIFKPSETPERFTLIDTVFNYWAVNRTILNNVKLQESKYSYFLSLDY